MECLSFVLVVVLVVVIEFVSRLKIDYEDECDAPPVRNPNVRPQDGGDYRITVEPPTPVMIAPQRTGNTFSMQVARTSGFTYYLHSKKFVGFHRRRLFNG